ncbi:MAG: hypothetical protein GYA48_03800 [Chloroflexi bacterium]|nr:hypothetical protein [Chloroflexota bacterium]
MVKKVILIGLLVLVSGFLVLGGINRTLAKTQGITLFHFIPGMAVLDEPSQGNGVQLNLSESREGSSSSDWVTLEGLVTSVNELAIQVEMPDGSLIVLEDRAWEYAQLQGFEANEGDTLQLTGFYEDDDFETATLTNLRSGEELWLRNNSGRPMWAGKGK